VGNSGADGSEAPVQSSSSPTPGATNNRVLKIALGGFVLLCLLAGASWLIYHHQAQLAAEKRRAQISQQIQQVSADLQRFNSIMASAQSQSSTLGSTINNLSETAAAGSTASQERHDDAVSGSPDVAAELQEATTELSSVNGLAAEISTIESSCTTLADSFASLYSGKDVDDLRSNCQHAVASWRQGQNDWLRAIDTINQNLEARANMRYWEVDNTDVTPYYQSSSNEDSDAETAMNAATDDVQRLTSRLKDDISSKQIQIASLEASVQSPYAVASSSLPSIAPASAFSTPSVPAEAATSSAASAQPIQMATAKQQGPLPSNEVLALLRSTAAVSVSSNPDGHTAYVTVPGTAANGTADANRIISGQLADGRWVVFVPLASGSASVGGIYSLMWVWANDHAQFVGEIPATNGGLGRLSTSIRNGEIYISWPICCPQATRTKILTLDGIRLRPLSDVTS